MKDDKKISRKEFLAYVGSLLGLFFASKVPKIFSPEKKADNHYGNNSYGGKA